MFKYNSSHICFTFVSNLIHKYFFFIILSFYFPPFNGRIVQKKAHDNGLLNLEHVLNSLKVFLNYQILDPMQ